MPATAPPKVFEHACKVFSSMQNAAVWVTAEDSGILVWEGFMTKLFQELRLPQPYYTSVLRTLRRMGCIRQLSRGGGNAPSRWELVDDPTLDLFNSTLARRRASPTKFSALEQRIADLNTRVATLESRVEARETWMHDRPGNPSYSERAFDEGKAS